MHEHDREPHAPHEQQPPQQQRRERAGGPHPTRPEPAVDPVVDDRQDAHDRRAAAMDPSPDVEPLAASVAGAE